ncbi:collagen binding domain-containing protein [Brochothrix thermosphacta]|uniref:collagen binding domain-containing protein n=1 Tax=Brochothrix thermosphacta TaxID=2756 RepID=UPI001C4FF12D|nr:collagen binding domain-containing protein [Brochothrix thermosphacta]
MLGKIVKVVAVLSLFLVSLSNLTTQVFAAEKGQEHITNIELLDGNNNPKSDFGQYESMQVKYDFSFKKGELVAGDTLKLQLPKELVVAKDITFDIKSSTDESVIIASAFVAQSSGSITITFNNQATKYDTLHGFAKFWVRWDRNLIGGKESVILDWGQYGQTTVGITPDGVQDPNETLVKTGEIDKADPTLIHWIIRVNYARYDLKDIILNDIVGPNQKLIPDSFRGIYADYTSDVDFNIEKFILPEQFAVQTDTTFSVDLGSFKNTAIIAYDTRATDNGESSRYTNTVKATGSEISEVIFDGYTQ